MQQLTANVAAGRTDVKRFLCVTAFNYIRREAFETGVIFFFLHGVPIGGRDGVAFLLPWCYVPYHEWADQCLLASLRCLHM